MTHSTSYQNLPAQDRFGLALAARLSESADSLPHDITERLRVARMQAVGQLKLAQTRTAPTIAASGSAATLTFGGEKPELWSRLASFIPLLVLIAGLVAINIIQNDDRAKELAEIDTALLTDDLPPAAYTDPGFAQFLRATPREQAQ